VRICSYIIENFTIFKSTNKPKTKEKLKHSFMHDLNETNRQNHIGGYFVKELWSVTLVM
jgi:hypothetical protein